ncbi:hypothetical protein B0H34DRAFT_715231 [Crassisporium funariophilum]|nr:hypothetical protein B0H34DRAFT_715231 [Crassisporium funariophilum]
MRWIAPPEKREITLVLLSLTVYFFAYNIESSMQILGIDPVTTQGVVLSRFGLGKTKAIGRDGRKPAGWRDPLETDIFGDWSWDDGHVAGDVKSRSQSKGTGRHGATWIGPTEVGAIERKRFGDETVNDALQRWGDDLAQTQLVKHVPGYTILDHVYSFNGTMYLITDSPASIPSLSSIVASRDGSNEWKVLTLEQGRKTLGTYGSPIRGVSWLAADSKTYNSTLFALWRTYSSLDSAIDASGRTKLASPHRLIFPNKRFFTDSDPDFKDHWIRRARVDTGFHPYLAKAAFPQLTVQYLQDWEDYHQMEVPFVFERLVIADQSVAEGAVKSALPVYSPALELEGASRHWWEPVRRNVAQYLGAYEVKPKAKKVVTYLHTQDDPQGPKLSSENHKALVHDLSTMARTHGYELNIVSTQTAATAWTVKMTAVVKSSIILSVYGNHLMDSLFMAPSPQSTVMEIFPTDRFSRDMEYAVRSLGLHYMAWWDDRSFPSDLPPVSPPNGEPVTIDARAITKTIHDVLSRAT